MPKTILVNKKRIALPLGWRRIRVSQTHNIKSSEFLRRDDRYYDNGNWFTTIRYDEWAGHTHVYIRRIPDWKHAMLKAISKGSKRRKRAIGSVADGL